MRVCIIATRLFIGGFTTSMINMINQIKKNDIDVDILFLEPENHQVNYCIEATLKNINEFKVIKRNYTDSLFKILLRLNIHNLDKKLKNDSNQNNLVKRAQLAIIYRLFTHYPKIDLTEYDCVISWEELTCNYFLAYNVKAKKKIGYVHPDYVLSKFSKEIDYPVFKKLDKIVSVSEGTLDTIKKVFPKLEDKMVYIQNVNNVEKIRNKANEEIKTFEKSSFDIVTVCRLSIYHKGLDRLLRIVKRLEEAKILFNWYVVGEGDGRAELESYINKNNIKSVHLIGSRENPYPYMKKADLFALQSNYEGRPVVVDEAIIVGTPVLVTNFESAKEQVSNEVGWVLEMDEDKIFEQLKNIIEHPEQLKEKREYLQSMDMSIYENVDKMINLIKGGTI